MSLSRNGKMSARSFYLYFNAWHKQKQHVVCQLGMRQIKHSSGTLTNVTATFSFYLPLFFCCKSKSSDQSLMHIVFSVVFFCNVDTDSSEKCGCARNGRRPAVLWSPSCLLLIASRGARLSAAHCAPSLTEADRRHGAGNEKEEKEGSGQPGGEERQEE